MKPVGLITDPVFEGHETGPGHPERPERARAVREALEEAGLLERVERQQLVAADDELLHSAHDPAYVRSVGAVCSSGGGSLDADTIVGPESDRIARLAAGSLAALCRRVAAGELERGFAVVRPPGHHAERDRAMGFCLYNNVAVAARELLRVGCRRVMIVDWDVHHGNGTQHIFESDADVLFASIHQSPLYPGTGARAEVGIGPGHGTTLNRPLAPGSGDEEFLRCLEEEIVPAGEDFAPEFVLVSAGFDAHRSDPLANLELSTESFAEATRILRGLAERCSAGRIVSVLEGGYDLQALADSARAHLEALF